MTASERWLLLPVETKAREFHAKLTLGASAAERGYQVVLGEQNAMVRQLAHLPRGLYIDKSIASSKTGLFRRLRGQGNKVAAWCEEGLVYRDRDAYLHQRISLESLAEVEHFFCWGDVQQTDVATKAPEAASKLIPTGNPRFDLLRPEYRQLFAAEAEALRDRFGDFILINTNFARYNHFYGENSLLELQRQRGAVKSKDDEAFLIAWRDFLGQIFHGFADMLAPLSKAFPERQIVLRPHPSENHQRWADACAGLDNVTVEFSGNVVPWLLASQVLIHNSCTTGLEAYLLDKPVISYHPARSEIYDSHLPNIVSHQADEIETMVTAIRQALVGEPVNGGNRGRSEAARYYASLDGALAAERVLDAVEGMNLSLPQPAKLASMIGLLTGHVALPARDLARRLLRPKIADYARQKFPGLDLAELRAEIGRLRAASGRFDSVRVAPMAHQCYRLTA